jgi:hypothetical protein
MSFLISPYNSLRFAKRDSLLPNYDNQLHAERAQAGLLTKNYCQLIASGGDFPDDEVTIQIRTDYDTSVTAVLIDLSDNSETGLTVTEKETYPDFSTWEFTHLFDTNGRYQIVVSATDSEQDSITAPSEPIYVDTEHKNTLLVKYYNLTNTEFVDYSTGIQHFCRVKARIPDGDDETDQDIYDNQNKKQKTYAATTFNGELTTDVIPEYLVRQLVLSQNLFNFFVNDKQYTGIDVVPERFGKTTSKQVVINCSEVDTPGVNSDDSSSSTPIPEEMTQNTYPLNLIGVSGNQQITIVADYMPDTIMFRLASGITADIKAGTSIGGDDISSPKTVNTANPVYTLDREYLKSAAQYGAAFIIYFTITGVGATVDINTIIKRYK